MSHEPVIENVHSVVENYREVNKAFNRAEIALNNLVSVVCPDTRVKMNKLMEGIQFDRETLRLQMAKTLVDAPEQMEVKIATLLSYIR